MSFEIRDELLHAKYLADYACHSLCKWTKYWCIQMYNQGMNRYNIFYMGMNKNVVIFLDCQPMFLENFVMHYILSMDMRQQKSSLWIEKSVQLHWLYLDMAGVI